jgi:branched-chain amino acid aminotransferase
VSVREGSGDVAAEHPVYVWWKNELVPWDEATVHVTDLAWSSLGAVFEGIRGYWNDADGELFVFRLDEHLERLRGSTRLVRLPLHNSTGELRDIIIRLLRANDCREDTYIFPLVYNANAASSRFDPSRLESELLIRTNPMPSHLGTDHAQHARFSTWTRISDTVMPPRIKNIANYRNGQLATHEVRLDGYDVAFMLNPQGKVAEAPGACVAFVRNGVLVTPDVTSGILESITRDAILTLAREELGIEIVERPVDRTELYLADEVFTCGTAAEITPVLSVDRYPVGSGDIGHVTAELGRLLLAIMRGEDSRYSAWRTPVGSGVVAGNA